MPRMSSRTVPEQEPEPDPITDRVIDNMLNEIWSSEYYQKASDEYTLKRLHEHYDKGVEEFQDGWFMAQVVTEEFESMERLPPAAKDLFREMYATYWNYKATWFYQLIAKINMKNMEEVCRIATGECKA